METDTIVSRRVFNLTRISEEEGLILRTLMNKSDTSIKDSLSGDEIYWNYDLKLEEAIKIGIELRDKIFKMVDKKLGKH